MAKNTIVDTVGHAVLQAEIAAVKAARRVIGAAQRQVASLGEAVGKKTKARKTAKKAEQRPRVAAKAKLTVRKTIKKTPTRIHRKQPASRV
jgi:hypothetical protein